MLYEVITKSTGEVLPGIDNIINLSVNAPQSPVHINIPVITSYSIHYTKLYDAHNKVVQKYADSYIGNNDSLPTPEEGIIVGEMYAVYREQLKKLPEKTRNIFLLSRNQGLKYSEIAEKLNISVSYNFV